MKRRANSVRNNMRPWIAAAQEYIMKARKELTTPNDEDNYNARGYLAEALECLRKARAQ